MSGGAAPAADAELNAIIALSGALEYGVGLVYKGFTVWQALGGFGPVNGTAADAGWLGTATTSLA